MRVIVFSDSHGRLHHCLRAMEKLGKADHMIHLGDTSRDAEDLGVIYPDIPISYVCGNCDFCVGGQTEKTVILSGKKLFLCHGHTYHVKYGTAELAARGKDADLVLFGHTHVPYDGFANGVHLFNPGSVALPNVGAPSFGVITIENGMLSTAHISL